MRHNNQNLHIPVLLEAVLTYLRPTRGESYLDLTAGYGGHAQAILERTLAPKKAILIDRDGQAIKSLKQRFRQQPVRIMRQDFLAASQQLAANNWLFDCIMADLGVSSPQLDTPERGFSIRSDGSLDMRMDGRQALSAATIVNEWGKAELTELLQSYGEEPKARAIAASIITNRPIHTTSELAALVSRSWPSRSRIHPATRTFQALRIAVNDELSQLEQALPLWINLLAPGGRLVIISFHSLEDRLVKQVLAKAGGDRYDARLKVLTKKPVTDIKPNIAFNPRARSAKLRAAVKIKNQ